MRKWVAGKAGFLKGTIFGALALFAASAYIVISGSDKKGLKSMYSSFIDNVHED